MTTLELPEYGVAINCRGRSGTLKLISLDEDKLVRDSRAVFTPELLRVGGSVCSPLDGRALSPPEFAAVADRAWELGPILPTDYAWAWSALKMNVVIRRRGGTQGAGDRSGLVAPFVQVRTLDYYQRRAETDGTSLSRRLLSIAEKWFLEDDFDAYVALLVLDGSLNKSVRDAANPLMADEAGPAAIDESISVWKSIPAALHELIVEGAGPALPPEAGTADVVAVLRDPSRGRAPHRGLVPSRPDLPDPTSWVSAKSLAERSGAHLRTAREAIWMLRDFWALRAAFERDYLELACRRALALRSAYLQEFRVTDGAVGLALSDWVQRVTDDQSHMLWVRRVRDLTETLLEYARAHGSGGFALAARAVADDEVVWEYMRRRHRSRVVDRGGSITPPTQARSNRITEALSGLRLHVSELP